MNNVKRVNAILWTANVLLIVGIVAFAFQFLILQEVRPREVDAPLSLPVGPPIQDVVDTKFLRELANPVKSTGPLTPGVARTGPVRLIGTDRVVGEPGSDTAYIVLVNRNLFLNAYVGEPIRDRTAEEDVPELRGWKLKKVTPTEAIFETPGEEITLKLDEYSAAPAAGPGPTGGPPLPGGAASSPWEPKKYTTTKDQARSNDNQEVWTVDRREVDWAAANWEAALQGVNLEPYSGGNGLKINALPADSFAAARGLRAGDVIKAVNNQPVDSIARLTDIVKATSRNTRIMSLTVDRGGRPYTLTYEVQRASR
jgi:hypothetical protein